MKINKTIIFTILKQSHSPDTILCLSAWGQSSLIFELPPERHSNGRGHIAEKEIAVASS